MLDCYISNLSFTENSHFFLFVWKIYWSKVQQFRGIKLFGNEVKLSLFADDTNLFTSDLASVRRGLEIVEEFGKIAGLWAKSRSNPLGMKWTRSPVKILGVHFSYDDKGNDELNFNQKLKVLQTKLDMWSSRDQNPRDISANLFRTKSPRPRKNRRLGQNQMLQISLEKQERQNKKIRTIPRF